MKLRIVGTWLELPFMDLPIFILRWDDDQPEDDTEE
jgi:hypothetical protein